MRAIRRNGANLAGKDVQSSCCMKSKNHVLRVKQPRKWTTFADLSGPYSATEWRAELFLGLGKSLDPKEKT